MSLIPDLPKPSKKYRGIFLKNSPMNDPDKDGFPNVIDCSDHNPKKQGIISWVVSKVKGKPYKQVEKERYAASEQRHQWRLLRLQRQKEITEARAPIVEQRRVEATKAMELAGKRMTLAERKTTLMGKRQAAMPSMFGTSKAGSMLSPWTESPVAKAKKKHRKHKKKRKK